MLNEQDKALAQELGLQDLPEEQHAAQIAQYYESLQMQVGMALEEKLSDEQLEAFDKVNQAGDDAATESWLRQAIPDYDQVIAEQTAVLKQQIKDTATMLNEVIDESSN